jgi:phage baseplate assembly protein W
MPTAMDNNNNTSDFSSKAFLGKGWKFPIQTDQDLKIQTSIYEENIKESIKIILGTRKGERVMRPDFGCGIHDFVFENTSSVVLGHIELSISEALTKYEPRIELLNIDISKEQIDNGILIISINYQVISTNNRFNIVYPFYIREG